MRSTSVTPHRGVQGLELVRGSWPISRQGSSAGPSGKGTATNPTQTGAFITAVLKNNGTTEYAIRGGDATGGNLGTYYKGALPAGWSPMRKEGAIVLGSGGDCCATNTNQSQGTFYEGCIVSGYPSDATKNAIQANIVAAGYSK